MMIAHSHSIIEFIFLGVYSFNMQSIAISFNLLKFGLEGQPMISILQVVLLPGWLVRDSIITQILNISSIHIVEIPLC